MVLSLWRRLAQRLANTPHTKQFRPRRSKRARYQTSLEQLENRAVPAVIHYALVNSNADHAVALGDYVGGSGTLPTDPAIFKTLRAAMDAAETSFSNTAGYDTPWVIDFQIAAQGSAATITLDTTAGPLPIETVSALGNDNNSVFIDGWSQGAPGYTGPPLVTINGSAITNKALLNIQTPNSTIRGLVLNNTVGDAIYFSTFGGNSVVGCYIGTNSAGTSSTGVPVTGHGIEIDSVGTTGLPTDIIGGTTTGTGNVISGVGGDGIHIKESNLGKAVPVIIEGNLIGGTTAAVTGALGNKGNGISVDDMPNIVIGTPGAGNVIVANSLAGIVLGGFTSADTISSNFIGTNSTSSKVLGNVGDGIHVLSKGLVGTNTIGGTVTGAGNVISGNQGFGIHFETAANTVVQGNLIGTDVPGTSPLTTGSFSGNKLGGIELFDSGSSTASTAITIGGSSTSARNFISGNEKFGIQIQNDNSAGASSINDVIQNNYIGLDKNGSTSVATDMGNKGDGIQVTIPSTVVTSGRDITGLLIDSNTISSNVANGIDFVNSSSVAFIGNTNTGNPNVITNNKIGTDPTGNATITTGTFGNGSDGILLSGQVTNTQIGGGNGTGNLISNNGKNGVEITTLTASPFAVGNQIFGNSIGVDAAASTVLPNGVNGILLSGSVNSTDIGGTDTGPVAGNIIGGNKGVGILLSGSSVGATTILANFIGTNNANGTVILGNAGNGIQVSGANNTLIGGDTPGWGNTIEYNQGASGGVLLASGINNSVLSSQRTATYVASEVSNFQNNGVVGPGISSNLPPPTLQSAFLSGGTTTITYTLAGLPAGTYQVQFFDNGGTNGPFGKSYLGEQTVSTGAPPPYTFTTTFPVTALAGDFLSATATQLNGTTRVNTSGFSVNIQLPPPPIHFVVSAPTTATAGTAFNFTVTAQDSSNNTVPNYTGTVHFTSTDPQVSAGSGLSADSTLSNGVGTFSATLKTAGQQTITATDTANSAITGTSNAITVSAAAATRFAVGAPTSAIAGTAFNFTVTAQDPFNNLATNYAGTIQFTSGDGQATMPANATLSSGTGTFSATLRTAGNQTITATDTANSSITGTSNPITVSAAAATHYTVQAPTSATAGTAISITVTAQDAFNNTAAGYTGTVNFTSNDAQATLPANTTLTSGTGTFSATLKTAGLRTITATDTANSSITGTSAAITVSVAATSKFVVSAPTSATAGTAFNFTVTAQDAFNNTTTGYTGTVRFTSGDAQATLPANSTLSSGTGTFSATLRTAGLQTLTATDTANSSIAGTSNAITVNAAAASKFAVSAPTTVASGTAFNFTVTAQDTFNNKASSYTGTVNFTSSDGSATLPANSTLSSGSGTFSATLRTLGNQTITATDTANGSITGKSAAITVIGQATHFTVTAPTTATAGTSFNVTVTALDASNNVAVFYTGTVRFTSSDSQATLPANSTLSNGSGTFSATLRTAGLQTITATDTANGSITGTSNAITVNAAAATHYTVQAPTSATAGTAFNFTVTAQDAFNNKATSYTGTVRFTSSDGQATLPANTTLSSGSGTFSATLRTAGLQTLTATDTANASITGQTGPITVSAAAATHYTVQAPTSTTAGIAFNFTVTAQDPFNNTATGYTGTVGFTSSDGAAALPGNSTLSNGTGSFSATLNTTGSQTLTATDTVNGTITGSATVLVRSAHLHPLFAVAQDVGGSSEVKAYDASTAQIRFDFFAYGAGVTPNGVRVAVGDVNGDGFPDIITVPGPGGPAELKVFDGKTGAPLLDFFAYGGGFNAGAFVAAGDVNNDGAADIIVGPDAGSLPEVKVFNGRIGAPIFDFYAYSGSVTGGVRVAAGDINGDGFADIITAPGPNGPNEVKAFDGQTGSPLRDFFAFSNVAGGLFVSAADANGDGLAEITVGAGSGGSEVREFDGATGAMLRDFFAFPPNNSGMVSQVLDSNAWNAGVRVGMVNVNASGRTLLLAAPGPVPSPEVRVFDALSVQLVDDFFAFDGSYHGGLNIGGGS